MSKSHIGSIRRTQSDDLIQVIKRQLKKIKYPIQPISPAQPLQIKISTFRSKKLDQQTNQKLIKQKRLNAYRQVRGDGNCFFRAFSFSYICSLKDLSNVSEVFYMLDQIDLTICDKQSIPKQFLPFYNNSNLKDVLQKVWKSQYDFYFMISDKNHKRAISRLLRQNPYLDFIVILYFRSLCLSGFKKYFQQFKSFMKGSQQQQIKTYGQQSEGVVMDICSRFLKTNIQVYQIRKNELKHYYYKPIGNNKSTSYLLFYQNHYDILETNNYLQDQKKDLRIQQQDFFLQKNQHMIQGSCLQCSDLGNIYQQNGLCYKCYQLSLVNFHNFQKDKMTTGTCNQCGRRKSISLQFGLCEQCINYQNNYQQKSKIKEHTKFKDQKLQFAQCLNCKMQKFIQIQTKLCTNCKIFQTKLLVRQEKNASKKKNCCPDCLQDLQSQNHFVKCQKKFTKAVYQPKQKSQIKKEEAKSFDKQSCKYCRKLILTKIMKNGICQDCWKKLQKQPKEQQICKKCGKSAKFYVIKNGTCNDCFSKASRLF